MATPEQIKQAHDVAGRRVLTGTPEYNAVVAALDLGIDPGAVGTALRVGYETGEGYKAINSLIVSYREGQQPNVPKGYRLDPNNRGIYTYQSEAEKSPVGTGEVNDYAAKLAAAGWVQMPSGVWLNPLTGDTLDPNKINGGSSGAEWGRLAVDQQRLGFDREKYAQDFAEGVRQFDATQGLQLRRLGIDEAALATSREQFASKFAEDQRQFNVQESRLGSQFEAQHGLERSRLEQEGLYQRGQLEQGNQRLLLEAQQIAAENAFKAKQAALAKQQYIGKVLSSPSDFIARAFMQRGQASPSTPITQADLINQINAEYASNPAGFVAPTSTPGAPAAIPQGQIPTYAEGTPAAPSASASSPPVDPEVKRMQSRVDSLGKLIQFVDSAETQHRLVDELAEAKSRLAPPSASGANLAGAGSEFGYVNDTQAIVGDPQVPGKPNPEMIVNPTGAPMAVVPMNRLSGQKTINGINAYDEGTQSAGGYSWSPSGTGGISYGGVSGSTAGATSSGGGGVWTGAGPTPPPLPAGMPTGSTWNGSNWTYSGPNPNYNPRLNIAPYTPPAPLPDIRQQLLSLLQPVAAPAPPKLSQEELVAQAEGTLPPALQQLFGSDWRAKPRLTTGGVNNPIADSAISPLKFGFSLFTPQSLGRLTLAEQEALNSYLGVKYNTTLEDVSTAVQQTFGKPARGGGRLRV